MLREAFALMLAYVAALKGAVLRGLELFENKAAEVESGLGHALSAKTGQVRAMGERGQLGLGTILAAFVVVIAAFVVIIVVDSMDSALGDPSNSDLNNASNDTLSGFASMVSLIEPLLLIAIAVVIISLIRRVQ